MWKYVVKEKDENWIIFSLHSKKIYCFSFLSNNKTSKNFPFCFSWQNRSPAQAEFDADCSFKSGSDSASFSSSAYTNTDNSDTNCRRTAPMKVKEELMTLNTLFVLAFYKQCRAKKVQKMIFISEM
jgi:hypothetical protein